MVNQPRSHSYTVENNNNKKKTHAQSEDLVEPQEQASGNIFVGITLKKLST